MPVWDNFRSPLAQLGYTSEDEAIYKDLKIDMTTVKEDVEYSRQARVSLEKNTNVASLFSGDSFLKYSPRVESSNIVNFDKLFYKCENLKSVSFIDLSKATSGVYCFSESKNITKINLSGCTLNNIRSAWRMFQNCKALEYVDVSDFGMNKVIDMGGIFCGCEKLKSVDVSNWNPESCTYFSQIFKDCKSLKSIDLSGWDMSKGTSLSQIFYNCESLDILKIDNLGVQANGWDSCFYNCTSLGSTEEGMESLRYTFITNSFDRTAAGYSALNLAMPDVVKARLTDEEKAAITAKGFTIV
jgi:surface protein